MFGVLFVLLLFLFLMGGCCLTLEQNFYQAHIELKLLDYKITTLREELRLSKCLISLSTGGATLASETRGGH